MLLDNYKKQSPIVGVAGLGGGINSYIFLSSGGDYVISKSLRFNSGDAAYLSRTPSATGNRRTWTWSNWIKRSNLGSEQFLLKSDVGGSNARDAIRFEAGDTLRVFFNGTNGGDIVTTQVFRDSSAWYHLVFAVDTTQATSANRVKIYINGSQITDFSTETYPTQNYDTGTFVSGKDSTIANDQNSNYLNGYLADVHFVDGQQLSPTDFGKTDDDGVWQPKKFSGSYGTNGFHLDFKDNSSNAALGTDTSGNNNTWTANNLNSGVSTPNYTSGLSYAGFNGSTTFGGDGPGGVGAFDSSESTRLTGNTSTGSNQTAIYTWVPPGGSISASSFKLKFQYFGTNSFGTTSVAVNGGSYFTQGGSTSITTYDFSSLITGGQITEVKVKWVANQSGIGAHAWYGMYINNVLLVDADPTGTDSLLDSPSQNVADQTDTGVGGEITGNYPTLNPVSKGSRVTLSNGNLELASAAASGQAATMEAYATFTATSGKFYAEVTNIDNRSIAMVQGVVGGQTAGVYSGGVQNSLGGTGSGSGASFGTSDVIGVAVDFTNKNIYFYKNNTLIYSVTGYTFTQDILFGDRINSSGATGTSKWNFGQRAFVHTAPSGYKALNTANLPDPTIAVGSKYFDTNIWDGNGTSRNITTTLSPDFVWIKGRSHATNNMIYDAVRGPTKVIYADTNSDEATQSTQLTAFNSDSFTIATANDVNYSGRTYVGYAWDAGSSTVTNNDGSVASQVRANQTAGFSILSYTNGNVTVGHGLSSPPELILTKRIDADYTWGVYSKPTTRNAYLALNSTQASSAVSGMWGAAEPTSSVFGSTTYVAPNGASMIAYCFAPVAGYSSIGSFSGGGSSGPFIYTGMRPSWIMIKRTDNTGNWTIWDTTRQDYNALTKQIFANTSGVEQDISADAIDALSNGFMVRSSSSFGGGTFLYMAFAEHPFKSSRAR